MVDGMVQVLTMQGYQRHHLLPTRSHPTNQNPNISRYIQWADELSLISSSSSKQSPPTLLGPLNFDNINESN